MTAEVRDSYDAIAELYAKLFLDSLDEEANARRWLAVFAELPASRKGIVADLGCGPGHVVSHLHDLGLTVVGYDLSPGQIAEARHAFPDLQFHVGDLGALETDDASLAGIISRYSIIHLIPSRLGAVFEEWMRVLEPGGAALVSFFGATSAEAHGTPFDHKVVTAYALFPDTIAQELSDAGFTNLDVDTQPPPDGGRPFDQGMILARKPEAKVPSPQD